MWGSLSVTCLFLIVLLMSTIRYFEGRYPHPYLLLLLLTSCILLSLPYFSFFTSPPCFASPFPHLLPITFIILMPFPHALPTPHPLTCHTTFPLASCSSASATPFPSTSQPTQPHVLSPPLPPSPDTVTLQFSCSP